MGTRIRLSQQESLAFLECLCSAQNVPVGLGAYPGGHATCWSPLAQVGRRHWKLDLRKKESVKMEQESET